MSGGEIYNAVLRCKKAELWSQWLIHSTGDIIYTPPCSEAHLSQMTPEESAICVILVTIPSNPFTSTTHTYTQTRSKRHKPVQASCGRAASLLQLHVAGSEENLYFYPQNSTSSFFPPDVSDFSNSNWKRILFLVAVKIKLVEIPDSLF